MRQQGFRPAVVFAGAWLVALSLAVTSCADTASSPLGPPDEGDEAETRSQTIKGGTVDKQSDAVMGLVLRKSGGTGICTGTLIAKNLILTARHCVASNHTRRGRCGTRTFRGHLSPSAVSATTDATNILSSRQLRRVSKIHVPKNKTPVCGHDLALVQLKRNVPGSKAKPRPPRVAQSTQRRESYTAIGYGNTGSGSGSGTRRRLGGLTVRCVGQRCNAPDRVAKNEFVGSGGVCQGDSGGGAYKSSRRVIGIAARADRDCRTSIYTRVYPWRNWIQQTTAQAASDGNYPVPSWTNINDNDGDGVPSNRDNCQKTANPNQKDTDNDGTGDKCDGDKDGDGIANANDNCPDASNSNQADLDGDGEGDACDNDIDGDAVRNASDLCPKLKNPRQRTSGSNDSCSNSDGDAWADAADNCPRTTNSEQTDSDNDGTGDACDSGSGSADTGNPSEDTSGGTSPDAMTGGPDAGTTADSGPEIVPVNDKESDSGCSSAGSNGPATPLGFVVGLLTLMGATRLRRHT